MLEQYYWIAGIVVAIAAVIGIFLKKRSGGSAESRQNANVSGSNNSVNQSSSVSNDE